MHLAEQVSTTHVPFVDLRAALTETESRWRPGLEALLDRAQFVLGPEVSGFEAEFATAMGARYAIGVSSGTAALELSLRASKMRRGADEVITTALTAPFTAVAIVAAGCKPRFADVDENTLLLDANDAGNRVTPRTGAVVPVHLYGQPYDVPSLSAVLKGRNIHVIQDACQAHAADIGCTSFTAFSPFVAYSFYPTKNLGCLGDGGAILTDDPAAARLLRTIRDGGRGRQQICLRQGNNARLDDIQACFLRAFLPSLRTWNMNRRRQARLYQEVLRDCDGVRIVPQRPGSVYHLFVIRSKQRDRLRAFLSNAGIGTAVHYPAPLHKHPAFRGDRVKPGDFRNAEKACREILSLPLRPQLADDDVLYVAECVRQFYRNSSSRRNVGS